MTSISCHECHGNPNIKINCELVVVMVGDQKISIAHFWSPQLATECFLICLTKFSVDQNLLGIARIFFSHLIKNGHQSNDWKKNWSLPKFFEHCPKNSITKFSVTNYHNRKWQLNFFSCPSWWPNFLGQWPKIL